MAIQQIIKGAIKVQGVPESACFKSFPQLLNALGTYLTVEIQNQEFSNVVISNQQPGQADRGKIWWRIANSGSFVGIYFFVNGEWAQIFPVPGEIFWIGPSPGHADSSDPPPGFKLLEASDGLFSPADYAQIIALAVPNGGVPPFSYYPAIFTGT
jgi:hypothetical protein